MNRYDWIALEEEYILSECVTISEFLKKKGITDNGTNRKYTTGWNEKKRENREKRKIKTIEEVTKKKSKEDAKKILKIGDVAEKLLSNILKATEQLEEYMVSDEQRYKSVKRDKDGKYVEIIQSKKQLTKQKGLIDRKGIKELTSALRDIKEITSDSNGNEGSQSLADAIQEAYENKVGDNNAN